MNQTQFATLFSKKSGVDLKASKLITAIFVECLQEAILCDYEIKFKNFGTLQAIRSRGFYRKNRYSHEREYVKTSAYLRFKTSNKFKKKLNEKLKDYLKKYDDE